MSLWNSFSAKNIDLLKGPIFPSLLRFSAPFMLTALVSMAYNLTDMMWIGRINADAVAAVGILGFIMWMGEAVSMIAQTGMGVYMAQAYGAGDRKETGHWMRSGYQLAFCVAFFFVLFMELIMRPFIQAYGLGQVVNGYAESYGRIVMIGVFFNMLNVLYSQAFQSLGDSLSPFRINAVGLIINVIMDPFLIFGLGPFPQWGMFGAGFATTVAQLIVFLLFARATRSGNPILSQARLQGKPDWGRWLAMTKLGLPVSLISMVHAGITMFLSRIIADFGAAGMAVTSMGSEIESISWMTADSFGWAMTSMIGQNVGAGSRERVLRIMRIGLRTVWGIGCFAMLIFLLFRYPIFQIFIPNNPETTRLGGAYLLIFSLSEPFMTLETGSSCSFNGLGKTVPPSVISIIFNVARVPFAYLFVPHFGVSGVWMGMSLSSILKGVVCRLALAREVSHWKKTGKI